MPIVNQYTSTDPVTARRDLLAAQKKLLIEGTVSKGFEAVREAFIENFTRRGEVGGACSVYRHGEKVVDLWGGVRDRASGEPWRDDTMVVVHSATKGIAAMVMALAHSRGWLDYDEFVATYWPEFAQNGKERITPAPAPRSPSRAVRIRRASRPRRGCRSRSAGRDHGQAAARLGTRGAAGLPCDHSRLLRGRAHPQGRPLPPHSGSGVRRRDRRTARGSTSTSGSRSPSRTPGWLRSSHRASGSGSRVCRYRSCLRR